MVLRSVLGLFCGVGMFLFSVVQMSEALKKLCGKKVERLLQNLTKNRLSGVLCGAGITAVVQSSAAVTVTAVSLADCGKLSLSSCVGIIMGSNIGTTVTGVLVALDFSFAAPLFVLFGAFCALIAKSERVKNAAIFFCAFGLLFVGIETMKDGAQRLNESGLLSRFFMHCDSKLSGILFGFFSTAVVQSSSATVGILQSLASVGAVKRESAVFIVCGQNIGATVPTLLSALRANEQARAAAIFHLIFNFFGTLGVLLLSAFFSISKMFSKISSGEGFVCAVHVLFNLLCTAAVFPFSVKISEFSKTVSAFLTKKQKRHL